jgi:hypothetical protein
MKDTGPIDAQPVSAARITQLDGVATMTQIDGGHRLAGVPHSCLNRGDECQGTPQPLL